MKTHDPYQAPVAPVGDSDPSRASISLKRSLLRVLGWTAVLFLVVNGIGMASGFSMSHWEFYGATMEQAIANARLVRRIAIGVACFAVYLVFLRRTPAGKRAMHALALFLSFEALDRLIGLLLFGSGLEFDGVVLARHAGVVLLALAIVTALAARQHRRLPRATL